MDGTRGAPTPFPITCVGRSTRREELCICTILTLHSNWGYFSIFLEENKPELCFRQKFPLDHTGKSSFTSRRVTKTPASNCDIALGRVKHTALQNSSVSASRWAARRPARLAGSPSAGRGAWQGVQASHLQTKRHPSEEGRSSAKAQFELPGRESW